MRQRLSAKENQNSLRPILGVSREAWKGWGALVSQTQRSRLHRGESSRKPEKEWGFQQGLGDALAGSRGGTKGGEFVHAVRAKGSPARSQDREKEQISTANSNHGVQTRSK